MLAFEADELCNKITVPMNPEGSQQDLDMNDVQQVQHDCQKSGRDSGKTSQSIRRRHFMTSPLRSARQS